MPNYQTTNAEAFNDLVGELQAGDSSQGSVTFMFPPGFVASGGSVVWELIDRDGNIYSEGPASSYTITALSGAVKVEAQAIINAPSDLLPTLQGQNYQIRWTLTKDDQAYFNFESIRITGPNTVPEGVEDVVELAGNHLPLAIVVPVQYDVMAFEVYKENEVVIASTTVAAPETTTDGYLYAGVLNPGTLLPAQLEPYTIVWAGHDTASPTLKARQTGRIYVVNPSILSAVDDMRSFINKSHASIAHQRDMLFTTDKMLTYLRRGRDAFNGAYGHPTAFTMLNAQGSIREFWMRFSEIIALRSQFLAEGEKSFNFQGQAISLDVDRTQYYQTLADNLQQVLDNECKVFKQNLIIKGVISGDGNLNPAGGIPLKPGAVGTIGITLTPVTGWSKHFARIGMRRF